MPYTVGSCGDVSTAAIIYQAQRKWFYANGRHWVFYSNGSNIGYKSSSDLINWTDFTVIGPTTYGNRISIYWDGRYIHYVRTETTNPVKYRKGIPNSNGTITWYSDEVTVDSDKNAKGSSTITMDSDGYIWLAYIGGVGAKPRIVKSTALDGSTWDSPVEIDSSSPSGFGIAIILSLSNNKMYCIYSYISNTIPYLVGKLYNGSKWDTDATILYYPILNNNMYSALSYQGKIYVGFNQLSSPYTNYLMIYDENTTNWSSPITVENNSSYISSSGIPEIVRHNDILYIFWESYGKIYYRTYSNNQIHSRIYWINDNIITYSLASYDHSIKGMIAMLWIKGGSYNVRIDYLATPCPVCGEDISIINISGRPMCLSCGYDWSMQ